MNNFLHEPVFDPSPLGMSSITELCLQSPNICTSVKVVYLLAVILNTKGTSRILPGFCFCGYFLGVGDLRFYFIF